jgi:hypothetical protein
MRCNLCDTDNLIDEMLEISHEQLNVTFHPWSVAIKESPVRVFRATPDDWHPTSLLQSGEFLGFILNIDLLISLQDQTTKLQLAMTRVATGITRRFTAMGH